jgi:hypothetical protein
MGVAGSAFSDANYTITKAQDGYVFTRPTSSTYGGNLIIGTSEAGSFNDVVVGVGSFATASEVARFHGNASNSGTFVLKLPTNASPAANTGAFQVWGGGSFSSNIYVGGAVTLNGGQTAGNDVKVKGKLDSTLIWARPGSSNYDQVLIGGNATVSTLTLGAKLQINSTDSLLLPVGTNAQRPSQIGGTDVEGMFRYSTTQGAIEWYNGTGWQTASTQFTVITDEQFSGDGSTTSFTMAGSSTSAATIVSINGVVQIPTLAYTVTGTLLDFGTGNAPASGDVIDVRRLTTTSSVTSIASATGYMGFSADNNGAYVQSGTVSAGIYNYWEPAGAFVSNIANTSIASASVSTIDTFDKTIYRTAKYVLQATDGTNFQSAEILVTHNGTTAYSTTYGVIQTGSNLGVASATISSNNVLLQFTSVNANTVVRVQKDYLKI